MVSTLLWLSCARGHLPRAPCHDLRLPVTSSRTATPPSGTGSEHFTFCRHRECMEFFPAPPKGGNSISKMGWGCSLWATAFPVSLLKRIPLLEGKEAAFLKLQHSWDILSQGCRRRTPSRSCRHHAAPSPLEGGWSRSRKMHSSPTNTPSGRPRTKRKYRSRKA